jgi:hypothetical protein
VRRHKVFYAQLYLLYKYILRRRFLRRIFGPMRGDVTGTMKKSETIGS